MQIRGLIYHLSGRIRGLIYHLSGSETLIFGRPLIWSPYNFFCSSRSSYIIQGCWSRNRMMPHWHLWAF